ncbi:MAG: hypothetical protein WBW36_10425 [Candidatus Sulfotelmatobacter sp.]
MGTASVIAAIGFGGTVFMLWVLIALLGEEAPTFRYSVALVAQEPAHRNEGLQLVSVAFDDRYLWEAARNRSDDCVELLENINHEKGVCDSGLSALDVCNVSGRFCRRPVHPKYSFVRWERGL